MPAAQVQYFAADAQMPEVVQDDASPANHHQGIALSPAETARESP